MARAALRFAPHPGSGRDLTRQSWSLAAPLPCKMVSGGSTATCKGNCHNSTNSTSSRIKASGALTFPLRNRWGSVEPDSRALVPKWSHERAAISYHDMHVPMHTNSQYIYIYIIQFVIAMASNLLAMASNPIAMELT